MKQFGWAQPFLERFMYTDTVTIYRQEEVQDEYGADGYDMVSKYVDVACKLSKTKVLGQSEKTDGPFLVRENLAVLLHPQYDIQVNDRLLLHHMGEIYRLYVKDVFRYSTHMELSVKREEHA